MKRLLCLLIGFYLVLAFVGSNAGVIEVPNVGAWNPMVIGGGGAAAPDCPSGTYMFYWDGDNSEDENYACVNSGASTQNVAATDGTDRVDSHASCANGQCFTITGADQYLQWTVTSEDIIDFDQGTIWVSVRVGDQSDSQVYVESYIDGNDSLLMYVASDESANGQYEGDNNKQIHYTAGALTPGTWYRIGYSWQADTGADTHCTTKDAQSWVCEDNITRMTSDPTNFKLGNLGASSPGTVDMFIDEIYITSGYQDADPQ